MPQFKRTINHVPTRGMVGHKSLIWKVFQSPREVPNHLPKFSPLSAADQLPPHALPASLNTWLGCGYLRSRNQDVGVSGGIAIASVPAHGVASYRRSPTPATL